MEDEPKPTENLKYRHIRC